MNKKYLEGLTKEAIESILVLAIVEDITGNREDSYIYRFFDDVHAIAECAKSISNELSDIDGTLNCCL